jgi:N-acetylglucosaminyl-diphospho-decaprenol L-rhamnosyltransferase
LVDVTIINWNTAEAALAASAAFLESTEVPVSVTIVDNQSLPEQRGILESVAPEDPRIRVIFADGNLGYGAAANLGLRDGAAPFVCVSNADVAPDRDALGHLTKSVESLHRPGMVGPVFEGGTQHYHSRLPNRAALLARAFVGSAGKSSPRRPQTGEIVPVDQVSGACFLMRRSTWSEVGGFDEGYFLWYDDVDLAKRLRDGDRQNVIVGSSVVRHVGAASFAQIDSKAAQAIRLASLQRYIAKHHPELLPFSNPLIRIARTLRARGAAPVPEMAG